VYLAELFMQWIKEEKNAHISAESDGQPSSATATKGTAARIVRILQRF